MTLQILIDMNLSVEWVAELTHPVNKKGRPL